jgi:hypothetical protein
MEIKRLELTFLNTSHRVIFEKCSDGNYIEAHNFDSETNVRESVERR